MSARTRVEKSSSARAISVARRADVIAEEIEAVGQERHHASQTRRVVELHGDRLGLAQARQRPLRLSDERERIPEIETDVDRSLEQIATTLDPIERGDGAFQMI